MNTKYVCEKLNISQKSLRLYEDLELIHPKRSQNNYRDYSEEDIIKIREIVILKELGFSLKEINLLSEKNSYKHNTPVKSLYFQMRAIEQKLTELESVKDTLKDSVNILLHKDYNESKEYMKSIEDSLQKNKVMRQQWIDKWNFDSWAVNYDKSVLENEGDELRLFENYEGIISFIRNRIIELKAKNILDIGCGTGNLCGPLSESTSVLGMDQSIEMLLICSEKYPNMKLKLGNFLDEPFREDFFDIIVSTYAFHHLDTKEKVKALGNMVKLLKSKGSIIIGDLMFLNENERNKCKDNFISSSRRDLWEQIEDEYYTDIESIVLEAEKIGCSSSFKHMNNFTWILEITKK